VFSEGVIVTPDVTKQVDQLKQARQIQECEARLKCGICMEKNKDTVIMPCVHFLYCHE
jgi:hypothetical protein